MRTEVKSIPYEPFTLETFTKAVNSLYVNRPIYQPLQTLMMGLSGKMMFDVSIELYESGLRIRTFTFYYKQLLWVTPYYKGNLWKIKVIAKHHYHVYHGTKDVAYCTTLKDCFKLIPEHKDEKHQAWKIKMRHQEHRRYRLPRV